MTARIDGEASALIGAAAREARKARQEATGAAARQARKERVEAQKEAERRAKEEAEAARQERVAQAAAARRQAQAEAAGAATASAPAESATAATASDTGQNKEKTEDDDDGEVCLDPVEEEARRKRLADKIAARRQAALDKEKAFARIGEEKRKVEEEKLKEEEEKNQPSSSSDESGEEEKAKNEEKAKKKKRKTKKKKKEKKRRKVDSSPSSDAFEMAKQMAEQAAGSFAWERAPKALDKVITFEEPGKAAAPPPDHKVDPGIEKMIEDYNLDCHAAGRLRELPEKQQKAALRFDLSKTGNPSMVCMSLLQELLTGKKKEESTELALLKK